MAAALLALVGGLTGCGASPSPTTAQLQIVTTTTVFADLVREVGGERVSVRSLVPAGGEVHTFDPRPSDVTAFASADLVVLNGLGLDDWVIDLVAQAGTDAPLLRLAEALPGVTYITAGAVPNPHLWMDAAYATLYVQRITTELARLDPAGSDQYRARGAAYATRLGQLDASIRTSFAALPSQDRKIVSMHDAFPYFARAYGLSVVGSVLQAPGQDPSAGQIADLIKAIRVSGVRVIISEAQLPATLVERIAEETGAQVVSDLYTDSVGPAPYASYEAMLRWDADRVIAALGR